MYDLKANGFDDSPCVESRARKSAEQDRDYLKTSNIGRSDHPFYLSLCKDSKEALMALGERFDFAINRDTGALALYSGTARKLTGANARGQVALCQLREFYRVKYAPFKKLYMEMELHDGVAVFTPSGEKL